MVQKLDRGRQQGLRRIAAVLRCLVVFFHYSMEQDFESMGEVDQVLVV